MIPSVNGFDTRNNSGKPLNFKLFHIPNGSKMNVLKRIFFSSLRQTERGLEIECSYSSQQNLYLTVVVMILFEVLT